MIGERNYMNNINFYFNNYVTFGDGDKIFFFEKRKLEYPGLPCLNNVLLVDGLTDNLITFSQLWE